MLSFSTHHFGGAFCFCFCFFPLDVENTGYDAFLHGFASVLHAWRFGNKCSLLMRDELWVSGKVGMVFKGQQKICRFVPNAASLSPVVLYQPIKLLLLQRQFKVPQTCFKIFIKCCTNMIPVAVTVLVLPGPVWMQHCRTNFHLHMNLDAPNITKPRWLHLYAVIYKTFVQFQTCYSLEPGHEQRLTS